MNNSKSWVNLVYQRKNKIKTAYQQLLHFKVSVYNKIDERTCRWLISNRLIPKTGS